MIATRTVHNLKGSSNMARRLIHINKKFLETYDRLGAAHGDDPKDCPFPIRKDVFMMAVTWGFLKNQSEDLPTGKDAVHDLFGNETFSTTDQAILTALYIIYKENDIEAALADEIGLYNQAERWAEAGLKWLEINIIHDTDQANLYSLCDWIMGNEFSISE